MSWGGGPAVPCTRRGGPPSALIPVALSSCVGPPVTLSNNTVPREPCLLFTVSFFWGGKGIFVETALASLGGVDGDSQDWLGQGS